MSAAQRNWSEILTSLKTGKTGTPANNNQETAHYKPTLADVQRVSDRITELERKLRDTIDETNEGERKYKEFKNIMAKSYDDTVRELEQTYGTAADMVRQILPTAEVSFPERQRTQPPPLIAQQLQEIKDNG